MELPTDWPGGEARGEREGGGEGKRIPADTGRCRPVGKRYGQDYMAKSRRRSRASW